MAEACSSPAGALFLRHILTLCSHTLRRSPDQALAIPLRMLEVFLSPQSYDTQPPDLSASLLERLNTHLVANGELMNDPNSSASFLMLVKVYCGFNQMRITSIHRLSLDVLVYPLGYIHISIGLGAADISACLRHPGAVHGNPGHHS